VDDRLLRSSFASGLTMLGAHKSEVSRYSYADLGAMWRQYGTAVRRDLEELFKRMVFNILVTNDDDHLRNHGFLWDGRGWRLSPLYDVVPKPQVGLDRRLVLGVGVEGRQATLGSAVSQVAQFDLSAENALTIITDMADRVHARWRACFEEAGLAATDQGRFATCFRLADPEYRAIN